MFYLFQIFRVVKALPMFFTNLKLIVLNFFILQKNIFQEVNFFKILKNRYFLLGGFADIIFGLFLDI